MSPKVRTADMSPLTVGRDLPVPVAGLILDALPCSGPHDGRADRQLLGPLKPPTSCSVR